MNTAATSAIKKILKAENLVDASQISTIPTVEGVYGIYDPNPQVDPQVNGSWNTKAGDLIYIGNASNLHQGVAAMLQNVWNDTGRFPMFPAATGDLRIAYAESRDRLADESLLLEIARPRLNKTTLPSVPQLGLVGQLLGTADSLKTAGEYAAAILIAQTAAEVAIDRAFSAVADSVLALVVEQMSNTNIGNDRVRALWNVVFEDSIHRELGVIPPATATGNASPDWAKYKAHCVRRNKLTHKGVSVNSSGTVGHPTMQDADDSLAVVNVLIQHVHDELVKKLRQ
jgi:hypothetical protein